MRGFLAPYRNVRYWLPDFRGGARSRNRKEIFNYVHSSLRNVIERSFGVLNARFPILKKMPLCTFPIQRTIVVAAMIMHNFIKKEAIADGLFRQYKSEELAPEASHGGDSSTPETGVTVNIEQHMEMSALRDAIGDALSHS